MKNQVEVKNYGTFPEDKDPDMVNTGIIESLMKSGVNFFVPVPLQAANDKNVTYFECMSLLPKK